MNSVQQKALDHIRRCDYTFDGKDQDGKYTGRIGDREFAYQQLRVLTLELVELLEEQRSCGLAFCWFRSAT